MIIEILSSMLGISIAALSLVSLKLYLKLTTGLCHSPVCLRGKTTIVTGANTGIGYETALDFAKRGAKVILACRDESRAQKARDQIVKETHNTDVHYKLVDLSSFKSVRKFADNIIATEDRLDILVNNAGAGGKIGDKVTEDGLPLIIQINYFSHFLLTNLLLDLLKKNPSRIINVSAIGAKLGKIDISTLTKYKGNADQYITSKLCQIYFTIELATRFKHENISAYSLHPGVIRTDIFRNLEPWKQKIVLFFIDVFFKTTNEGAQTQIYCSVENDLETLSGEHFHDCHHVKRYKSASDPSLPNIVWTESEKIVGLKLL